MNDAATEKDEDEVAIIHPDDGLYKELQFVVMSTILMLT